MLKKAGIVLALSAAGLLSVSPLAFAGDYSDDDGGDHDGGRGGVHVQRGLVNLQDVAVQVPIQACNNSILEGTLGILAFGQRNSDSHDGTCAQRNRAE